MKLRHALVALALVLTVAPRAHADAISSTLYFTTFLGGQNVWKVDFTYDGGSLDSSFTLGSPVNIASTGGADGIVFAPDGDLLIGGQGAAVHKVDPSDGSFTSVNPGVNAFHLSVDPSGETVWAASIPGQLGEVPLNPFGAGTAHSVCLVAACGQPGAIATPGVDTLAWVPDGAGGYTVYYTSSGSGGNGSFGMIDMTTFVATPLANPANAGGDPSDDYIWPAAHGMVYDPLTKTLILMGDSQVTQVDPDTNSIVASKSFVGVNFDQGTVDGEGHLFVADNNGDLLFMDYLNSGLIDDPSNFFDLDFLAVALDDIAPKVGPGAPPVPEPMTLSLLGLGVAAVGRRQWKRRATRA